MVDILIKINYNIPLMIKTLDIFSLVKFTEARTLLQDVFVEVNGNNNLRLIWGMQ